MRPDPLVYRRRVLRRERRERNPREKKKLPREILGVRSTLKEAPLAPGSRAAIFFLRVLFDVSLDGLRVKGTTRDLLLYECT